MAQALQKNWPAYDEEQLHAVDATIVILVVVSNINSISRWQQQPMPWLCLWLHNVCKQHHNLTCPCSFQTKHTFWSRDFADCVCCGARDAAFCVMAWLYYIRYFLPVCTMVKFHFATSCCCFQFHAFCDPHSWTHIRVWCGNGGVLCFPPCKLICFCKLCKKLFL